MFSQLHSDNVINGGIENLQYQIATESKKEKARKININFI